MGRDQTAFFLVYYKIYFCVFNEGSIENDIQYQDGHIILLTSLNPMRLEQLLVLCSSNIASLPEQGLYRVESISL